MGAEYVYNGNVIDFEASGLSAASYPIEVGLMLDDRRLYHTLIRPEPSWTHWCSAAAQTHGIHRSELLKFGKPVTQVCYELNQICQGLTLFSDCWVKDSEWLTRLFTAGGIEPSFYTSPIEYCIGEDDLMRWSESKNEMASREKLLQHRALADAYLIKLLLDQKVLGRVVDESGPGVQYEDVPCLTTAPNPVLRGALRQTAPRRRSA